jgi:hypothetical protein
MAAGHPYWRGLVMTEAALKALEHGIDEQDMTVGELRTLGLAAERKRAERKGRYITVADADRAIWEVVSSRWKG